MFYRSKMACNTNALSGTHCNKLIIPDIDLIGLNADVWIIQKVQTSAKTYCARALISSWRKTVLDA
jgi:hypothetical protein